MYKDKNVLVAGGTGAIGIPLVKNLVSQGANVRVVSLDSLEYSKCVLPAEVSFMQLNLTTSEACKQATKGVDYVFNLMCIKGSVSKINKNPEDFINYILFQTNLMHEAYKNKVDRFMFVGSICSYPQMSIAKKEDDMWEGLPRQNDVYAGIAKRLGEIQGEMYFKDKFWEGVRIVRPCNCYGPFDDFNIQTAQVIPALIAKIESNITPVKIIGDGRAIRDFVYMDDIAEALLLAMIKAPPCYPINIGSGNPIAIKELAQMVGRLSGRDVEFEHDDMAYSGDPVRYLDVSRMETLIGFHCKTSLEEGIVKTFDWYRHNKNLLNVRKSFNVG
jgi:GDP-L-fucose synthase